MGKQKQRSEHRQIWIDEITKNKNTNYDLVLKTFINRGASTLSQIERVSKLSTKQVRIILDDFVKGKTGFTPIIRTEPISLLGQPGRPKLLYILNEDGASVLQAINPDCNPIAPLVSSPSELVHTFMETEISTLAAQEEKQCDIEAVCSFGDKNYIRVDNLIQNENQTKVIFEMEQLARIGDIPRIIKKLENLNHFFSSSQSSNVEKNIRILFNLASNDRSTIKSWKLAFLDVQKRDTVLFKIFWMPILQFFENPRFSSIEGFFELETKNLQESSSFDKSFAHLEESESDNALIPPFMKQYKNPDLSRIHIIVSAMSLGAKEKLGQEIWPSTDRPAFFDLIRTIYQVSHYKGGPVFEESAIPVLSLNLLYRYIHMHQNQGLLDLLITGREEVRKSTNRGINMFRDTYSRLCWNFMRYHGFGRLGPIQISVQVPYLSSDDSEVSITVNITNEQLITGIDGIITSDDLWTTNQALAWVLNSFWIYGEELCLTIRKVKKNEPTNLLRLFP